MEEGGGNVKKNEEFISRMEVLKGIFPIFDATNWRGELI